ncbi:MAG: HAD-IIB family hydrolase [Acidobacteriaceae bacterium]|nr:HAD-IIB family hydrolase [Acidobacteriaceae bacterium]
MRFILLATDYDGTLASDGKVNDSTTTALERVRASGRKLVLVTGRHLPDLSNVFARVDLFDRIVVENGGVLYQPETRTERVLSEPPNPRFIALLEERKIPFSLGRTIVATWQPHEEAVLSAIRESGLDLQMIFNKGSVMVLPSGVNKGTGLRSALDELGISPHNVVSVGDAENDLAFLRMSACSVAVANALPSVKEKADVVLDKQRGDGVIELSTRLIKDDLADFDGKLERETISLGRRPDSSDKGDIFVNPRHGSILVAGPSGSGKSTAVAGLLEQFGAREYQFCLIDPEGDYEGFTHALSFGNAKNPPDVEALLRALEQPKESVLVDLLAVAIDDRPKFFSSLLPQIQDLRTRTARPHWVVVDEAHHMLPSSASSLGSTLPQVLQATLLITVHPEHVAAAALNAVDVVVAIGKPVEVFRAFAEAVHISPPRLEEGELATGEAMLWFHRTGKPPVRVKTIQSTKERLRHVRNYAEGELSQEQSFYFRGRKSKLNLRAQNLRTFLQLADGIDDETWMYHLQKHDYSGWFRSVIKDDELGQQAAEIERDNSLSPEESRHRIKEAVERRYTAPA